MQRCHYRAFTPHQDVAGLDERTAKPRLSRRDAHVVYWGSLRLRGGGRSKIRDFDFRKPGSSRLDVYAWRVHRETQPREAHQCSRNRHFHAGRRSSATAFSKPVVLLVFKMQGETPLRPDSGEVRRRRCSLESAASRGACASALRPLILAGGQRGGVLTQGTRPHYCEVGVLTQPRLQLTVGSRLNADARLVINDACVGTPTRHTRGEGGAPPRNLLAQGVARTTQGRAVRRRTGGLGVQAD